MTNIVMDFGSSQMRMYVPSKGVLTEPALIATNTENEVMAVSKDALKMLGKTAKNITIYRPFCSGKIVNLTMAEYMIASYIKKYSFSNLFLPNVIVCVPDNITKIESNTIINVLEQNGIRKISFVSSVKSAFIATEKTKSIMHLHIGFKSGFCAVMANEQLISYVELKVGGDTLNKDLTDYLRKTHGLSIGPLTAEFAKEEIGGIFPRDRLLSCHVKGRNIYTGLPNDIVITSDETIEAYSSVMTEIAKSIEKCIENVPDELLSDIVKYGINISGGTAKLYGIDKYLQRRFKVPFKVVENPQELLVNALKDSKI
ncbi:MAG: rod shape-determining protein [Clostridia bacterium]